MSEQNMALLSQSEIDTLISFLSSEREKDGVGSEVLSQNSIDKLINLIKTNHDKPHKLQLHLPISMTEDEKIISFFSESDKTYSDTSSYELLFEEDGGKIYLRGKNIESGALVPIRPCDVSDNSSEDEYDWGACIMPSMFNLIASFLHLKYTQDTMDAVYSTFAKIMFGNADAKIPAVYLPSDGAVFLNLMSEE